MLNFCLQIPLQPRKDCSLGLKYIPKAFLKNNKKVNNSLRWLKNIQKTKTIYQFSYNLLTVLFPAPSRNINLFLQVTHMKVRHLSDSLKINLKLEYVGAMITSLKQVNSMMMDITIISLILSKLFWRYAHALIIKLPKISWL